MYKLSRKYNSESVSTPKNPASWMYGWNGFQNYSGIAVNQDTALTFSAVYRAVTLIAGTIASLPAHLYRRTETGREVENNHFASKIIREKSDDDYTGFLFRYLSNIEIETWGNSYWEIIFDYRERPIKLKHYHPSKVRVLRIDGVRWYYVQGKSDPIPYYKMLHLHGPSFDGVTGLSPIMNAAVNAIGIGMTAEKFQGTFFKNGTHMGGVVELPNGFRIGDTEDDEQIKLFRKSLQDNYQGSDNFHKLLILEPGMKFQTLSMPLESAQFLQTRKFQVEEIARFYGVPPHLLANLERSTNNNIEQEATNFVQYCLLPRITMNEVTYNDKLLTEKERSTYYFKMNVSGLLRGDIKSRADFYKVMLGGSGTPSVFTADEVRELEDLNRKGADALYRPLNTEIV